MSVSEGDLYLYFFGRKHLGIFFFQSLVKVFQEGCQRNQPFYHAQQSLKQDLKVSKKSTLLQDFLYIFFSFVTQGINIHMIVISFIF